MHSGMEWTPAKVRDDSASVIDELFHEGLGEAQQRVSAWFERYVADFDRVFVHGSRSACRRLTTAFQKAGIEVCGVSLRPWSKMEINDRTARGWSHALGLDVGPWDSVISTQSRVLAPEHSRTWEDFAYPRLVPARLAAWRWPEIFEAQLGGEALPRLFDGHAALQKCAKHLDVDDQGSWEFFLAQLRLAFGWGAMDRDDLEYPAQRLRAREIVGSSIFDIDAWYERELKEAAVIIDYSSMNDRFFGPLIETQHQSVDVYIRASISGSDAPLQSIKAQLGPRAASVCTWLLTFDEHPNPSLDPNLDPSKAANDQHPVSTDLVSALSPGLNWSTYLSDLWFDASEEDLPPDFNAERFSQCQAMDPAQLHYLAEQGQHLWSYFGSLDASQSIFLRIRQAAWEPFNPALAHKVAQLLKDHPHLRIDWESASTLETLLLWGAKDEILAGRTLRYIPGSCPASPRLILSAVAP